MARKTPEQLRSHRWFGVDDLRAFGHRSRMLQMGFSESDFRGKPIILPRVRIKNVETGATTDIPVSAFFVAIGHQPNSGIFKPYIDMDEAGYIKTIPGSSKTNVEGVFAAGDVQDKIYRQAVTAAGSGCMAALDAERYLSEKGFH